MPQGIKMLRRDRGIHLASWSTLRSSTVSPRLQKFGQSILHVKSIHGQSIWSKGSEIWCKSKRIAFLGEAVNAQQWDSFCCIELDEIHSVRHSLPTPSCIVSSVPTGHVAPGRGLRRHVRKQKLEVVLVTRSSVPLFTAKVVTRGTEEQGIIGWKPLFALFWQCEWHGVF